MCKNRFSLEDQGFRSVYKYVVGMCKSLKTVEGDRLFPVNKSVNNVHNP